MKLLPLTALILSSSLLVACGGGSGGTTPDTTQEQTSPNVSTENPANPRPDMSSGVFGDWESSARYESTNDKYFSFVYGWNMALDGQIGLEASMQYTCMQGETIQLYVYTAKRADNNQIGYTTASLLDQGIYGSANTTDAGDGSAAPVPVEDAATMTRLMYRQDLAGTFIITNGENESYIFDTTEFKAAFDAGCSWHPDFAYFTEI